MTPIEQSVISNAGKVLPFRGQGVVPGQEAGEASAPRRLIDVKQAAEMIGCDRSTVYQMVREKQIPATKIRSRIFFHPDKLDAWLRAGGTAGTI
ncbi:helix-turn-helix domain-containing protein [Gorillibacterium timonense]|uniref:helix-turn-helix domain-containing protein n=1 Tax=Gorillibacterium timonense TaxID=1689269 RepID=UPI00071C9AB5|nr:helix-turn-helix domain-containing protein [Gorillibacterium timonense]